MTTAFIPWKTDISDLVPSHPPIQFCAGLSNLVRRGVHVTKEKPLRYISMVALKLCLALKLCQQTDLDKLNQTSLGTKPLFFLSN